MLTIAATLAAAAVSGATSACGSPAVRFESQFAPGFVADGHSISVLGVYKDGQMSSEAWGSIAPKLLRSFGGSACEAGYTVASGGDHAGLIAAVDDYARDNGPTDELVAQLSPAAKGDLILTLTVAGHPPAPEKVSAVSDTGATASMRASGPRAPQYAASSKPKDTNALDLVATLFSVSARRTVGEIAMEYTGETVEDALAKFSAKLAAALPHARCAAWDWSAPIDPGRIGHGGEAR